MSSINGLLFVFNRRKPVCCCTSPPLRVTGIKLHYIRLLAGIRLVLSITAPANNPTEHRAQTHHYTDYFLHPLSCLLLSTHSFISLHLATPFLYPLLSVSFHSLLFPIFPSEPFTSPSSSLSSLGERGILLSLPLGSGCKASTPSSAGVVLIETIILFLVPPLLLHTLEEDSVRTSTLNVQYVQLKVRAERST